MSYDLELFMLSPGQDLSAVLASLFDRDVNSGPLVETKEKGKASLAQALTSEGSDLVAFAMDYQAIAASKQISPSLARERFRQIELHEAHDEEGIHVAVYDDFVTVSVPLTHQWRPPGELMHQTWACLERVVAETGYAVYDPQLDIVLDLKRDFDQVLSHYATLAADVPSIIARAAGGSRPWWRFWS